ASTTAPATADVTRGTLVETKQVDGTLGYGDPDTLAGQLQGILTRLPAEGATVTRGQRLYAVDEQPVILMYGTLPAYRALKTGDSGGDVRQLEQNLRALGYTGFTVDDSYTAATADAVRDWQDDLGLTETGTVEPGRVVFLPSAVRVAEHKSEVGQPAGGAVFTYTGTARLVTVDLDVNDRRIARKGAPVAIELPGGQTASGTVASVGAVAHAAENESQAPESKKSTVDVIVAVKDTKQLGDLAQGPVRVRFVAGERKNVLTVPVVALLALREGGYGVEVVTGSGTQVVEVELGLFADGRVEITGKDISEGTKVRVPAS
ncbi:MAG: peptidoglycan-binding protein, partial [Jiangellaceae bacterium]